jgi:RIO kinase 1
LNATEDKYEVYEEQFNPLRTDRQARRSRKPRVRHISKKSSAQVIGDLGDTMGVEAGLKTTYKPGLFEEGWLLAALQVFYDQALITDVLYRVKGGKEANVYCCAANPSTGVSLLAAKVYRPRMFRNLRNDQAYREGRQLLTADGRPVKTTDHRLMRAIGKKTAFGQQVAHTSWLMYEYTTLEKLFRAGAAVPKPFAVCENAVLMRFCGDERLGAPALNETAIETDEAEPLFRETLRNVEIMLRHGLIGDLSAYNILYWEGEITLIDFPQVTNSRTNGQADFILERDVRRVCEYFARYGVQADAAAISRALWDRYVNIQPVDRALDVLED